MILHGRPPLSQPLVSQLPPGVPAGRACRRPAPVRPGRRQACLRRLRLSHQLHRAAHLPAHLRRSRPRALRPHRPNRSLRRHLRRTHRCRRRRGHRAAPRRHGIRVRDALAALDPEDQEPAYSRLGFASSRDEDDADPDLDALSPGPPGSAWRLRAHTVRILGFGPSFDVAGYEQNGHLLVDFGIDSPWVPNPPLSTPTLQSPEDEALDETAQIHIQQNVEKLLAFTLLVEKNCGISSRLLWTESGKPLAEKLIARLQRVH